MKGLRYSAKTTLLRTRGRAAEKEKGGRTWGPSVVTGSTTERWGRVLGVTRWFWPRWHYVRLGHSWLCVLPPPDPNAQGGSSSRLLSQPHPNPLTAGRRGCRGTEQLVHLPLWLGLWSREHVPPLSSVQGESGHGCPFTSGSHCTAKYSTSGFSWHFYKVHEVLVHSIHISQINKQCREINKVSQGHYSQDLQSMRPAHLSQSPPVVSALWVHKLATPSDNPTCSSCPVTSNSSLPPPFGPPTSLPRASVRPGQELPRVQGPHTGLPSKGFHTHHSYWWSIIAEKCREAKPLLKAATWKVSKQSCGIWDCKPLFYTSSGSGRGRAKVGHASSVECHRSIYKAGAPKDYNLRIRIHDN